MPIVHVHGVAVRDERPYPAETETFLKEIVAPAVNPDDPGGVEIIRANWFKHAAKLAWEGRSIPGERSSVLGEEVEAAPAERPADRLITAAELGPTLGSLPDQDSGGLLLSPETPPPPRLRDLSPDDLSNLLASVIEQRLPEAQDPADQRARALYKLAADDVAHDPDRWAGLGQGAGREAEIAELTRLVQERYQSHYAGRAEAGAGTLGPFDFVGEIGAGLKRALDVAGSTAGFAVTKAVGPLLKGTNAHFAIFMGDILTYLRNRGTPEAPGAIPKTLLDALAQARDIQQARNADRDPGAHEPLVVLSHSMGGQLVYDLVTAFLPGNTNPAYDGIRIDLWAAAASQVSYFEEVKVFLADRLDDDFGAPPRALAPFPDRRHLGAWWNVWDPTDYLSFTARDIFVPEVEDFAYHSGLSGLQAHGGYLIQPAFFRHFAARINRARERGWR